MIKKFIITIIPVLAFGVTKPLTHPMTNIQFQRVCDKFNLSLAKPFSVAPWLSVDIISTKIENNVTQVICHITMSFKDKTNKTTPPKSIGSDLKVELSNDRKSIIIGDDAEDVAQKKREDSAISEYLALNQNVIKHYYTTKSKKALYVYNSKDLILGDNIIANSKFELSLGSKIEDINNKDTFLFSTYTGGYNANAIGFYIMQIDKNGKTFKTNISSALTDLLINMDLSPVFEAIKVDQNNLLVVASTEHNRYFILFNNGKIAFINDQSEINKINQKIRQNSKS